MHDTAVRTSSVGTISLDAGATVTYTLFSNIDCTAGTTNVTVLASGDKTVIFFFNDPATAEIYPLSLHDALPIFAGSDIHHTDSTVSDCEPFHVNKATPGISTVVKDAANNTDHNSTRMNSIH